MKLFLTSAGIIPEITDEFLKLLGKNPKGLKLIFIPTAVDPETDEWFVQFVQNDKKQLAELGFDVCEVDLKNETEVSLENKFTNVDVVYVEGGNTFYLLDWVKKSGFNKAIKKFLKRERVYVGVSAGSMIAGTNIESANWEPADKNIAGLGDLSAISLLPFAITPHYCDEVAEAVKEAAVKAGYPIVALTDSQAVLIDGNRARIIGSGEKIVFNNPEIDF